MKRKHRRMLVVGVGMAVLIGAMVIVALLIIRRRREGLDGR